MSEELYGRSLKNFINLIATKERKGSKINGSYKIVCCSY